MTDTNRLGKLVQELRPHAMWCLIVFLGGFLSPVLFWMRQKAHHASLDWYVLAFLFASSLPAFTWAVLILVKSGKSSSASVRSESAPDLSAAVSTEISPVPTYPQHEGDGSAPDVRFWHSVGEREAHGRDVRALLSGAQRRVIITGIELHYVVKYCANELQSALSRGRLVGIVIAKATPRNITFYGRYSRGVDKTLAATHDLYRGFAESLDKRQSECFALYHTDVALTHSIGLYDDAVYVSEFCIDCPSSLCPSFSPPPESKSHSLFISELKEILKGSPCVHGSGHVKLLGGL